MHGREGARQAGPHDADRDPHLATGRPREELTERDEIRVRVLGEPLPLAHVLVAEVAEVRDRPAERGEAEARRHPEHLEHRALRAPASHDRSR